MDTYGLTLHYPSYSLYHHICDTNCSISPLSSASMCIVSGDIVWLAPHYVLVTLAWYHNSHAMPTNIHMIEISIQW